MERLSPEKRERMERTLRRMEFVRRNDDMKLRDLIETKHEWAVQERQKGIDLIEQLENQVKEYAAKIKDQQDKIRHQVVILDGCLIVLDDLISEADAISAEEKSKLKEDAANAAAESKKKAEELVTKPPVKDTKAIKSKNKKVKKI